eukprot:2246820-Pleurochrysis_carterae.AAC.1
MRDGRTFWGLAFLLRCWSASADCVILEQPPRHYPVGLHPPPASVPASPQLLRRPLAQAHQHI